MQHRLGCGKSLSATSWVVVCCSRSYSGRMFYLNLKLLAFAAMLCARLAGAAATTTTATSSTAPTKATMAATAATASALIAAATTAAPVSTTVSPVAAAAAASSSVVPTLTGSTVAAAAPVVHDSVQVNVEQSCAQSSATLILKLGLAGW